MSGATAQFPTGSEPVDGTVAGGLKPLVYIAGPYTNPDPIINVRKAVQIAEWLGSDIVPVVPHLTMLWHLVSPHPLEWWYQHDLDLLARCDALWRFAGASTGADAEVDFAQQNGVPVFGSAKSRLPGTATSDFRQWLALWLKHRRGLSR